MKMYKLVVLAASFLGLSSIVSAKDINYDFWEVGYLQADFDGADADGFGVAVSHAFDEKFHFVGSYASVSGDDYDFDVSILSVGLGYHSKLNDKIDFFGEASVVSADSDVDDRDTEIGIRGGLRGHASEMVELLGALNIIDGEVGIEAQALFAVNSKFQFGVGLTSIDDRDTTSLFLRGSF